MAAAHASCFSMALAAQLGERGITPEQVAARSFITCDNGTRLRSARSATVRAPGADRRRVEEAAEAARVGCPIARVLKLEVSPELSAIPEEAGIPKALERVQRLVEGHETVARTARQVFQRADDDNDQPTCDLLTQRMQVHEKTAWMLRSLLE